MHNLEKKGEKIGAGVFSLRKFQIPCLPRRRRRFLFDITMLRLVPRLTVVNINLQQLYSSSTVPTLEK